MTRTIFNNIIDIENQPPKNMEYIYILDEVWKPHQFGSVKTLSRRVVHKVEQMKTGNYEFEFAGEFGVKYCCTYGWAFYEHTPENIEFLAEYDKQCKTYRNRHSKTKDKATK